MIALALGGRTIAEWQAAMTQPEFEAWAEFYRRWPFDDRHRYYRPAVLVAGALSGGPGAAEAAEARMEWLQPSDDGSFGTSADRDLFRAAGVRTRKG